MARALLVEDDVLGGMLLQDMLIRLGYEVFGPVERLEDGLRAVAAGGFVVAVLDVNLLGEMSFPIADALRAKQIPYLYATGYGEKGLDLERRGVPVLTKPFSADKLASALRAINAPPP